MPNRIIIIEPSFVLRQGLHLLLKSCFPSVLIEGEQENCNIGELTKAMQEEDILFINEKLYLQYKDDLQFDSLNVVVLTDRDLDVPCLNYRKTTEKELLSIVETIIGNKDDRNGSEVLTESEQNVLRHIAQGLSNRDVAEKLFLSVHTVMTHRKNITRKLDIKSVSGLTVYAILNNLVDMDEVQ